jgi:hypothetical protein
MSKKDKKTNFNIIQTIDKLRSDVRIVMDDLDRYWITDETDLEMRIPGETRNPTVEEVYDLVQIAVRNKLSIMLRDLDVFKATYIGTAGMYKDKDWNGMLKHLLESITYQIDGDISKEELIQILQSTIMGLLRSNKDGNRDRS